MLRETNPKTKAENSPKFAKLPAFGIPINGNTYLNPKEGRRFAILKNGRRIFIARYVMTQLIGAEIPTHLHVHHIDGNKLNDHPENLELIDGREHARRHAQGQGKGNIELICPSCEKSFDLRISIIEKKRRQNGDNYQPTCCKPCAYNLLRIRAAQIADKKSAEGNDNHVEFICACGCGRSKSVPGWKFRSNEKRGRKNVFEHSCATRLGMEV